MTNNKQVVLLPGTGFRVGSTFKTILPETNDIAVGEIVTMTSGEGSVLGTAEVVEINTKMFALLVGWELSGANGFEFWHAAYERLQQLVPGFSQTDIVDVVVLDVKSAASTGLTLVSGDTTPTEAPADAEDLTDSQPSEVE